MSDWTWKQTIAEAIIRIVNDCNITEFKIDDLYAFSDEFSKRFPRNKHVNEKIRQILQRLRDDNFLVFKGSGEYELNMNYSELETISIPLKIKGKEKPEIKEVMRKIILRSTILGAEMKRRYNYLCQVCKIPIHLRGDQRYAEAHHLKPIGSPHFGPDVLGNIIVLCPNHHVMFDLGAATILPDNLKLLHSRKTVFSQNERLYLEDWHMLKKSYLNYHHYKIFKS